MLKYDDFGGSLEYIGFLTNIRKDLTSLHVGPTACRMNLQGSLPALV